MKRAIGIVLLVLVFIGMSAMAVSGLMAYYPFWKALGATALIWIGAAAGTALIGLAIKWAFGD